LTKQPNLIGSL